jgi:putative ABC transport system permease protein
MVTFLQDLRFAIRTLGRNPGFAAVAVVALALGIGANTAIFSVVNAVLLRPLPFPEPDRLVWIWGQDLRRGIPLHFFFYSDFLDLRAQAQSFESATAYSPGSMTVTAFAGGAGPERLDVYRVNAGFLRVLRVQPFLGRDFLEEEDRPGARKVALIANALWQRRFGSDPNILGKPLVLDGSEYTVVGVLPAGFQAINMRADVFTPIAIVPGRGGPARGITVGGFARLKPRVSTAEAQTETNAILPRLDARFFGNSGRSIRIWGAREFLVRDVRHSLWVLAGAVGLVLLIACANVANLLLARAGSRQKEIAIRAALGAGRMRVVRQLLTESAVLGIAGGALGLGLAWGGVKLLISTTPARYPLLREARVDVPVLLFTLVVALLTSMIFGLAPAVSLSRAGMHEALKEGGRSSSDSRRRNRLHQILVAAEVALALVLAIGAGLLIKGFGRLVDVNPGFNPRGVLTAGITLPGARYPKAPDRAAFFRRLLQQLDGTPGVEAAGLVSSLPLSGHNTGTSIHFEGRPELREEDAPVFYHRFATSGYFRAMQIPLRQGRLFTEQDTDSVPPVAVINETMVRRFFADQDPLGKRFAFGPTHQPGANRPAPTWITIVGVVGDVHHTSLAQPAAPEFFICFNQLPSPASNITVRTAMDPARMAPTLRAAAAAVDKEQPVSQLRNMEQVVKDSLAERRLAMWLLGIFAALAVVLAAVGIYGVMSYAVARRTREIGVRLALGASPRDVLWLVFGQAMRVAALGLGVGLAGAFALTRLMRSILYEVGATDPLVFAAVGLLLAAVAALASFIPARRATRVEPVAALHYE